MAEVALNACRSGNSIPAYPTIVHPFPVATALSSAVNKDAPQLLVMVMVFAATPGARLLKTATKAVRESLQPVYEIVSLVPENAALVNVPQLVSILSKRVAFAVFSNGRVPNA